MTASLCAAVAVVWIAGCGWRVADGGLRMADGGWVEDTRLAGWFNLVLSFCQPQSRRLPRHQDDRTSETLCISKSQHRGSTSHSTADPASRYLVVVIVKDAT
jgi:hypothetical protein